MEEQKNYKVYIHTLPNGKRYVGITKQDVKDRWRSGKYCFRQLRKRGKIKAVN